MAGAPTPTTVYTKLQRIAEQASNAPQMAFNNLAHLVDLEFLREAYRRTRKNGAPGIDRMTAEEYGQNLESNLQSLLERMKSGQYKAPPVKRVHIPKDDKGNTRPIGMPTFEDKVLQRAVAMVLETIYEQDFSDCSFGYRPGRSAHQALEVIPGR
jgi:retron-type reverse transcriptase